MEKVFKEQHLGSFLQILGEDTEKAIKLARDSRLGISLLLGVDANAKIINRLSWLFS